MTGYESAIVSNNRKPLREVKELLLKKNSVLVENKEAIKKASKAIEKLLLGFSMPMVTLFQVNSSLSELPTNLFLKEQKILYSFTISQVNLPRDTDFYFEKGSYLSYLILFLEGRFPLEGLDILPELNGAFASDLSGKSHNHFMDLEIEFDSIFVHESNTEVVSKFIDAL